MRITATHFSSHSTPMSATVILHRQYEDDVVPIRYQHKFTVVRIRNLQAGFDEKLIEVFPTFWEHAMSVQDTLRKHSGTSEDFLGAGIIEPRQDDSDRENRIRYNSETCESRYGRDCPADPAVAAALLEEVRAALIREGILIAEGQPLPKRPGYDDDVLDEQPTE